MTNASLRAAVRTLIATTLIACFTTVGHGSPQSARELFDAAVAEFAAGRIERAAAEFDRLVEMAPGQEPYLWQRGIALYYAGRFEDCRAQFELHRTVNPNDVENAAWHFICVAAASSPEQARAALLPVGPDSRAPMGEIYRLFRGEAGAEQVLAAAGNERRARFYAELYVGLYQEAHGREASARAHLVAAAADGYSGPGNYMHMVARVHVRARGWGDGS